MVPFEKIKASGEWTLFLDRDGTINRRLPGSYVSNWNQFEFLPKAKEAIKYFSQIFQHVIVVTNQQGIGKELMTTKDLKAVHDKMISEIMDTGGYIDQIYFCPHLAIENPTCRKPNPGMAFQAAEDFPTINFKKSLMIGDMISDMHFGHQLGMYTILLQQTSNNPETNVSDIVNMELASLNEVATYLMHS